MSRSLPPFFSPGFPLACPLCLRRLIDGEPTCRCVQDEEDFIEDAQRVAYEDELHERWEEYDVDYDAEEHARDAFAYAYACWAAPEWENKHRDAFSQHYCLDPYEDYDAWVRAFPKLPWDESPTEYPWNQTPVPVDIVPGPPTAWWHSPPPHQWDDPWETWETLAEEVQGYRGPGRRILTGSGSGTRRWAA
jgi:hypothetical protein